MSTSSKPLTESEIRQLAAAALADEQLVGNGWSQPTPLPGGNWPMQLAMGAVVGLMVGSVAFGVARLAGLL